MPETVFEAFARGVARQERRLWTQKLGIDIATDARHMAEAILERQRETLKLVVG